MNSGEHIEAKLIDFAYGELPVREASLVQRHLDQCTQCSKALFKIQGVRRAMAKLPAESAPTEGTESLLTYARRSARRKKIFYLWPMRWAAPAGIAAALVLVIVVAMQIDRAGRLRLGPTLSNDSRQEELLQPSPRSGVSDVPQAGIEAPAASDQSPGALAPVPRSKSGEATAVRHRATEKRAVVGGVAGGVLAGSNPSGASKDKPASDLAVPPEPTQPAPQADQTLGETAESRKGLNEVKRKAEPGRAMPEDRRGAEPRLSVAMQAKKSGDSATSDAEKDSAKPEREGQVPQAAARQDRASRSLGATGHAGEAKPDQASIWAGRAANAKQSGNRMMEITYLRRAIETGVEGPLLLELLVRLCDAQRAQGSLEGVRESCGQIARDFPATEEARFAERVLKQFTSEP